MNAHMSNKSFEVIPEDDLPEGANVINTGLIFSTKIDSSNNEIIKARLCAKGYAQKYGVDYFETYAPTVDPQTIRAVLAYAIQEEFTIRQLDVKAAFLIPRLPKGETVYTNPPTGYLHTPEGTGMVDHFRFLPKGPQAEGHKWINTPYQYDEDHPGPWTRPMPKKTKMFMRHMPKKTKMLFRWFKAVYGLKNAMYLWNQLFGKILDKLGYEQQLAVDSCFYIKRDTNGKISGMLLYHVDDLLVFGRSLPIAEDMEKELSSVLPIKTLGRPIKFLGIEFEYYPNGDLLLHQESYLKVLLERFKQENCHTTPTPALAHRLDPEGVIPDSPYPHREAIGGVMWPAIMTRPDIIQAATQVAQFTAKFRKHHWDAVMRILHYLKGTMKFGIVIRKTNDANLLRLRNFCDADFAGDFDRKSYSGSLSYLWGTILHWSCKKIKNICLSVQCIESELVTMSRTALRIRWQIRLVKAITGKSPTPVPLYCDNQGSIDTSVNGVRSRRGKHIDIADLFVLEAVKDGWLIPIHIPSAENEADFLTKPLNGPKFKFDVEKLGLQRAPRRRVEKRSKKGTASTP